VGIAIADVEVEEVELTLVEAEVLETLLELGDDVG
jgi:hypothetical protein